MVETLHLDQSREKEIVTAIRCKLNVLDSNRSPGQSAVFGKDSSVASIASTSVTNASPYPPSTASPSIAFSPARDVNNQSQKPYTSSAQKHHSGGRQPDMNAIRAHTEPPSTHPSQHIASYNEPKSAIAQPPNPFAPMTTQPEGAPINASQYTTNHTRPKVFQSGQRPMHQQTNQNRRSANPQRDQQAVAMTMNLNKNQLRNNAKIKSIYSAPVSPGTSPTNEIAKQKRMSEPITSDQQDHFDEYSDVCSNAPVTDDLSDTSNATNSVVKVAQESAQLVSGSLLDQIMALPPETLKSRIRKFGGTVSESDGNGILVAKLFQLLSNNNAPKVSSSRISGSRVQVVSPEGDDLPPRHHDSSGLLIQPHNSTGTLPNTGQQKLGSRDNAQTQLMNAHSANPAGYHSDVVSSQQSVNTTPPNELNVPFMPPITNTASVRQTSEPKVPHLAQPHFHSAQPPRQHQHGVHLHAQSGMQQLAGPQPNVQQPGVQRSTVANIQHVGHQQARPRPAIHHAHSSSMDSHQSISSLPSIPSHSQHDSKHSAFSETPHNDSESPVSQQETPTITPQPNAKVNVAHHHHQRSGSNTSINSTGTVIRSAYPTSKPLDDGEQQQGEIDPNEELKELRKRKHELMKQRVANQKKQLKELHSNRFGKDNKMDDIASELSKCDKRIKVLLEATKSGGKIPKKDKKIRRENSHSSDKEHDEKSRSKRGSDHSMEEEATMATSHIRQPSHESNRSSVSTNVATAVSSVQSPPRVPSQDTNSMVKVPPNRGGGGGGGSHGGDRLPYKLQAVNDVKELQISHGVLNQSVIGHSRSSSQSLIVETDATPFASSSPLISSSAKDEFMPHLQHLPPVLDLGGGCDLDGYINGLFNQSQTNLKALSIETLRNAKDRVQRERRALEDEYKQYYEDQTEMLMLKLNKHRENLAKRDAETQATRKKLREKQQQQSTKFESIVRDQLQILQLTQELNDDTATNSGNSNSKAIPEHEEHLYKDELDKQYFKRVQEFKLKQEQELKTFQNDLARLSALQMDVYKKQRSSTCQSQDANVMANSSSNSPMRVTGISPQTSEDADAGNNSSFMLQSAEKMEPSRSMPSRSMADNSLQNGHAKHALPGNPPAMSKARSSIPQHSNPGFCIQPMSAADILSGTGNMSLPIATLGDGSRISCDDPFSPLFTSASVPSILDQTPNTGNSHMNGNHMNGSMNGNATQFRATVGAYPGGSQKNQSQQQLHHQQQQQYLQQTQQGKVQYRQQTTNRISGQNPNPIQNQLKQQHARTHSTPNPSHGKSPHGSQTLNTSFDLPSNNSNINTKK